MFPGRRRPQRQARRLGGRRQTPPRSVSAALETCTSIVSPLYGPRGRPVAEHRQTPEFPFFFLLLIFLPFIHSMSEWLGSREPLSRGPEFQALSGAAERLELDHDLPSPGVARTPASRVLFRPDQRGRVGSTRPTRPVWLAVSH